MQVIKQIQKVVFFCLVCICAYFIISFVQFQFFDNNFFLIQAQEKVVENTINASLFLNEKKSQLKINIFIENKSQEQIITKYEIPDVWDLEKITKVSMNPSFNIKSNLKQDFLVIDFSNVPLKPGQKLNIYIEAESDILKKHENIKYIQHPELLNTLFPKQELDIKQYKIHFPVEWQKFDSINIKDKFFSLKKNNGFYELSFSQVYKLQILWGKEIFLKFEKSIQNSASLEDEVQAQAQSQGSLISQQQEKSFFKPLYRESLSQDIYYENIEIFDSVYKDYEGNIFAKIDNLDQVNLPSQINKQPKLQIKFQSIIKPQFISEVDQESFSYFQKLDQLNNYYSGKNESSYDFPIPYNISQLIRDNEFSNFDTEQKVEKAIELIKSKYKIKALNYNELYVSDKGVESSQEINYLEYLLLINSILKSLDIENTIVLIDKSFLDFAIDFYIELCDTNQCEYYKTQTDLANYEKRQVDGLGFHLLAFKGLNQLSFSLLRNIENFKVAEYTILSNNNKKLLSYSNDKKTPEIKLVIPEQVYSFSNFSSQIILNNTTEDIIFLDALIIENRTFPIIDDSLAGLRKGVLPGNKKELEVKNVFIPKIFMQDTKKVIIKTNMLYEKGSIRQSYKSNHSVLVKQNYFFWGMSFVGIATLLVSFYILYLLVVRNKYIINGAYWQFRRIISEVKWQISKKVKFFGIFEKIPKFFQYLLTNLRKLFRI